MNFFQSELVRGDIQEMVELQQFCFRSAMNFVLLNTERRLEYFEALVKLIEKQKVFYYRIKLSDDPEAKSVLETMKQSIIMLGATPGTTIEQMFDELLNRVHVMKTKLESDAED
jgi:Flp pilus assembly secretin CpaC